MPKTWEYEVDQLIELAELAEESAQVELEVYGCIEFEPQFNWRKKAEERGEVRAMVDICREEYLPADLY